MSYNTATIKWIQMIRNLLESGVKVAPRGQETVELIGYQSIIDMRYPVVEFAPRKLGKSFLPGEAWWILTGRSDVESIKKYTKAIAQFSDDGESFFGAYGPKITEQLPYLIRTLERDPSSRQGVLNIWRENPPLTKDVPCTLSVQFLVRNKSLHCNVTMRSSDAWLGWPYDVFNFSMLSLYVGLKLNSRGVYHGSNKRGYSIQSLGDLRLTAGSQHFYLRDHQPELEDQTHKFPPDSKIKVDFEDYGFVEHEKLLKDLKDCADRKERTSKCFLSPYYE